MKKRKVLNITDSEPDILESLQLGLATHSDLIIITKFLSTCCSQYTTNIISIFFSTSLTYLPPAPAPPTIIPHLPEFQNIQFSLVQFSSVAQSCLILYNPWTAAHQGSLSITSSPSLPKLMSIEWVMPSNHLILCHSLLLLPSIFPSIWVFSNESVLHIIWTKNWSFSFSISPCNEYSVLISFRRDWLDLLAVQGTLKSLLQHHSSKASILQCSTFFIVQLSHPYMNTGKTIALTRWTFVGKVLSLHYNMLSGLVITFLPRSKCLLNS